jgi:hypothetical protein
VSIVTSKEASHVHHTTDITASLVAFLSQLLIHLANRLTGIATAFEALFDVGQNALKSLNLRIGFTHVPQNIHREIGALGMAA